jgi:protein-tyrosine phosphatase
MAQAIHHQSWDDRVLSGVPSPIRREEAVASFLQKEPLLEPTDAHRLHRLGIYPITPQIAVGSSPGPLSVVPLLREGVTHLYNLRSHVSPWAFVFRQFFREVLHTPVMTTSSLSFLTPAILFQLHRIVHKSPDARVLIHCREGISRSVTSVCAYLIMLGIPAEEAQRILRVSRPGALPGLKNHREHQNLMNRSAEIGLHQVHRVRSDILAKVGPASWDKD